MNRDQPLPPVISLYPKVIPEPLRGIQTGDQVLSLRSVAQLEAELQAERMRRETAEGEVLRLQRVVDSLQALLQRYGAGE